MRRASRVNIAARALCITGGLAIGISGFSADSNHPTYLPPALHYLDPSYLAHDWWLSSATQYHFAFFAIVVLLAKLGVLEFGLAVLNAVTVAGGLYACFRIIIWTRARAALIALAILVAMLLATRAFFTAGNSYLFTSSLQPSTVAAAATISAIAAFLEGRYTRCGIWLGTAGIFHVNFLIANVPLFGLAYLMVIVLTQSPRAVVRGQSIIGLLKILGPSLIVTAAFAPLIVSVAGEALAPTEGAKADWIFFRFAVPFHYYPLTFIQQLISFAAWQTLGVIWTARAVPSPDKRRAIWSVQISLGLVIWSATAFTTIAFLPLISRLFLWRLAPFAMLIAAIMVIVGTLRCLCSTDERQTPTRKDLILLLGSFVALAYAATSQDILVGQSLSTGRLSPALLILAVMFVLVGLRWWIGLEWRRNPFVAGTIVAAALCFGLASQPSDGKRSRYSLLVTSRQAYDEQQLFDFVKRSTPMEAQFLIPPDLDFFRLCGERAILVDFKALPMNQSALLEWYRRLEDISGAQAPANMDVVRRGFDSLDAVRLDFLRSRYGVGYVVLPANKTPDLPQWSEVFSNRSFRVLRVRTH